MPGIEDVMDSLSGMITRKQAKALLERGGAHATAPDPPHDRSEDITNVVGLLEFVDMNRKRGARGVAGTDAFTVDLRDSIYRIFNPASYPRQSAQAERRTVVLGTEGFTIKLGLRGLSALMDSGAFERGDTVLVSNALLDLQNCELKEGKGTSMRRVSPTKLESVVDYSVLTDGMRNIDIIGKVVEVSPVRHVSALSGGTIAVADCMISDLSHTVGVSLWESSALAAASLHVNDFIKVEFCGARVRNEKMEVYAGNLSRVVANKAFAGRLRAFG
jgi:hypothetical protein